MKPKKVQEKHNKLNCVDYDAGIVQTLLLAADLFSEFFNLASPLSLRVLLWLLAGGCGDTG